MTIVRLQSDIERRKHHYYEFDSADKPLGEGGMGKVFRGRCIDERTGIQRDVAIKFMFSDLPDHVIERARRESSIKLRSDNLVEMLGFIEIIEENVVGEITKRYHVVSELLEGVMLDNLLLGKTTDQRDKPILFAEALYREYKSNPFQFAITIIRNILSGIMTLHDAGYIHRDIDPTNIMITQKGHIKLIDFGIAKSINTLNTHDKALTTAGMFMGKPWYAAPELVLGDVRHQNMTTDIYAIGILFYQLYIGQRPFDGANHEVLDMQLHKRLPLRQIAHKDIKAIIAKATQKKQELRYQSAYEFRVDIDKLKAIPQSNNWIIGGIGTVAVLFISVWVLQQTVFPSPLSEPEYVTFNKAISMLRNGEEEKGIYFLDSLVKEHDYNATFLLSRLYFNPAYKKECDHIPDSIWQLQYSSHISPDHEKSQELLKKAVSINPNDYNSLYALGCEYLIGNRKTLEGRNLQKSETYLDKALLNAKNSKDQAFIKIIEDLKEKYKFDFDN